MVERGTLSARAISRTVLPAAFILAARSRVARSTRLGRPQVPPSASILSRAAATRSDRARFSMRAAHAMTASTTSAAGPSNEKPSATVTISTP